MSRYALRSYKFRLTLTKMGVNSKFALLLLRRENYGSHFEPHVLSQTTF